MKNIFATFLALFALIAFTSCEEDVQDPGSEYMPDMGHSIANESNVLDDYYYNTWDDKSQLTLREIHEHNLPVQNTVPRGYAGVAFADGDAEEVMATMSGKGNAIAVPVNGSVPYYYTDTAEERTRAIAEIQASPFPITEDGLARGKELYNTFCGICHGEKGDGNGWLVDEANQYAAYPAAPANFLLDDHINSSNGRYYHAIMYGKNVMGAYKDKINYEERWQVIHYIRALQAKEKKVDYNADKNSLNPTYGVPEAKAKGQMADMMSIERPSSGLEEQELDPGTDVAPLEEPVGGGKGDGGLKPDYKVDEHGEDDHSEGHEGHDH